VGGTTDSPANAAKWRKRQSALGRRATPFTAGAIVSLKARKPGIEAVEEEEDGAIVVKI
jgi:hypothetical protein